MSKYHDHLLTIAEPLHKELTAAVASLEAARQQFRELPPHADPRIRRQLDRKIETRCRAVRDLQAKLRFLEQMAELEPPAENPTASDAL